MHTGRTIEDLLELVNRVGIVVWGDSAIFCREETQENPPTNFPRAIPLTQAQRSGEHVLEVCDSSLCVSQIHH